MAQIINHVILVKSGDFDKKYHSKMFGPFKSSTEEEKDYLRKVKKDLGDKYGENNVIDFDTCIMEKETINFYETKAIESLLGFESILKRCFDHPFSKEDQIDKPYYIEVNGNKVSFHEGGQCLLLRHEYINGHNYFTNPMFNPTAFKKGSKYTPLQPENLPDEIHPKLRKMCEVSSWTSMTFEHSTVCYDYKSFSFFKELSKKIREHSPSAKNGEAKYKVVLYLEDYEGRKRFDIVLDDASAVATAFLEDGKCQKIHTYEETIDDKFFFKLLFNVMEFDLEKEKEEIEEVEEEQDEYELA